MRRMYSKEQLQKLIDEVSRLIAIEELDKVVPVPSVAKAGYYMAVNSAGTGYVLVPSPDSTHLYWHGINMYANDGTTANFHILNNSSTLIDTLAKVKAWAEAITGDVIIACIGCIKVSDTFRTLMYIVKNSNNTYDLYYMSDTQGSKRIQNINLEDYFTEVEDASNQLV